MGNIRADGAPRPRLQTPVAALRPAGNRLLQAGRCVTVVVCLTLGSAKLAYPEVTRDESGFFPRGAHLDRVARVETHAEGPALGPDGLIYFCDLTVTAQSNMEAGAVYSFDPKSRISRVVLAPSGMASGIKFDRAGNMVMASGADFGSRAITQVHRVSHRARFLAADYQGRRLNSPNDLAIDSKGRIFFTDPRYFRAEPLEQAVSGVYRIDPDGSISLVTATMSKPNGIVLSLDEKMLFVGNNDNKIFDRARQGGTELAAGPMQIVAFDLTPDGNLGNRRIIVDFGNNGGPDGLAVDKVGNIWAAVPNKKKPGVGVYTAQDMS